MALVPIMERVLGPEHPTTLIACSYRAHWTGEAGDAAAAREQYAALLPIAERVLGLPRELALDVGVPFDSVPHNVSSSRR